MRNSQKRTPDEDAFAALVSSYLWGRYEMLLPEAPGYITQNILDLINEAGLTITKTSGERNAENA